MSIKFRSYLGKSILAMIRQGDFAHPGEKAAIDIVMSEIKFDSNRQILDVACGLGGTAKYIQDCGKGQIVGIDTEAESIIYARKTYPNIKFLHCDVIDLAKLFQKEFDLITIFSAFFFVQQ